MIRLNKTAVQANNYETNIRPIGTFTNVSRLAPAFIY